MVARNPPTSSWENTRAHYHYCTSLFLVLLLRIHTVNTTSTLVTLNMNNSGYPRNVTPFLDLEDEDDNISSAGSFYSVNSPPNFPPPPPLPPPRMMTSLKLPTFWADAPVAWFAAVEAQFRLRQVTSQSSVTSRLHSTSSHSRR